MRLQRQPRQCSQMPMNFPQVESYDAETPPPDVAVPMAVVDPTPDLPRIVEIHGYDNGSECTDELHQLRPLMLMVESNGAKEDATYYDRMAQIEKHKHKSIGYKMVPYGSWLPRSTWNSKKIMVNVDNALTPRAMFKIFE